MTDLLIRIKKNKDGSASLACVRDDGSTTWQRQEGKLGAVFPPHDLTHYAVERTLGYDRAFYGLIAEGWEMTDFAAPYLRGPIPPEAREVETYVGALDFSRRNGEPQSAEEFNAQARFSAERDRHRPKVPRALSEDELARIRAVRDEALARWHALEPGGTLELSFERASVAK